MRIQMREREREKYYFGFCQNVSKPSVTLIRNVNISGLSPVSLPRQTPRPRVGWSPNDTQHISNMYSNAPLVSVITLSNRIRHL